MLSQYFKSCLNKGYIPICHWRKPILTYGFIRVKDRVHKGLKCREVIAKTKEHNHIFIMTIMSTKYIFMHMWRVYSYMMETSFQIELSEVGSSIKSIKHIINSWNRKSVHGGYFIERPIISAKSTCTIFFLTNNIGPKNGLVLGCIKPNFSISWTCFQFQHSESKHTCRV